jgi:hypothetical protein
MTEVEAQTMMYQRLRMLQLDKLVKNLAEFEPLIIVTGGNPKAIEIALGLVKHERRPLQEVVDDLHAARGDLFDDLFVRAWALLDEAARRVLLVTTFFPDSASGEALSATADVQGFAFDRAVERLNDLALLDVQQETLNSPPRYTLHPLVRAFATMKLEEQSGFEAGARERWVEWYKQLVERINVTSYSIDGFAQFEIEEESVFSAMTWAIQNAWFAAGLRLVLRTNYYYYVRGIWDKNIVANQIGAVAAHHLSEFRIEMRLLAYYVQRLIMQGNLVEAERQLGYIESLYQQYESPAALSHVLQHTRAHFALAQNRLIEAREIWEDNLQRPALLDQPTYGINTQIWIADCLYRSGELEQARNLATCALTEAMKSGYVRGSVALQLRLAAIANEEGDLEVARKWLDAAYLVITQYTDRPNLARYHRIAARLYTIRRDLPAARLALAETIDLFERLGMRRELAEAREELARLDAGMDPIAEAAETSADTDELFRPTGNTLVE